MQQARSFAFCLRGTIKVGKNRSMSWLDRVSNLVLNLLRQFAVLIFVLTLAFAFLFVYWFKIVKFESLYIHLNKNRSKYDNNYDTMRKNLFSICMHSRFFGFASSFYDTFKYFNRIDYPLTRILFDFSYRFLILEDFRKENKKIGYIVRSKILLF